MSTDAYRQYLELEARLYEVMDAGKDVDDGEGDKLRDEMDPLWWAMTDEEREEANNTCAKRIEKEDKDK